jgi:hypothetical protein
MKSIDPFSIQSGLLLRGGRAQWVLVLIALINTQLDDGVRLGCQMYGCKNRNLG